MGSLCLILLVGICALAYISHAGDKLIDEKYDKLDKELNKQWRLKNNNNKD